MKKKAAGISHRIDAALYRRGFDNAEVRQLVRWQILMAGAESVLAMVFSLFSAWGFSFLAGAALVTVNFYHLARFVQQIVHVRKGAVVASLIRFYGRLIVTGVILYVLIVWAGAHVVGLLAGLSTVLVTALVWGVNRMSGKNVKEA